MPRQYQPAWFGADLEWYSNIWFRSDRQTDDWINRDHIHLLAVYYQL